MRCDVTERKICHGVADLRLVSTVHPSGARAQLGGMERRGGASLHRPLPGETDNLVAAAD